MFLVNFLFENYCGLAFTLTLRFITKYDNVITIHDSSAYYNLQYPGYYNSQELLLQLTTLS